MRVKTHESKRKETSTDKRKEDARPEPNEGEEFAKLVSLSNLRKAWKSVRTEIRSCKMRDALDWLDWAVTLEAGLGRLRGELLAGEYYPLTPMRYELAKSRGAFRVMTLPNLRDAIVYHLICDRALQLAAPKKVPGAYFSRRHAATPIGRTLDQVDDPSSSFWSVWLRYQQYRTRTMLNSIYTVLVVADISNYFDSISHELLMEYLSPLGLPRKAVGILGRLLEVLKPTAGHSPNPRIGIPVDECDCSRALAHIFLFEHDRRVAERFGEDNYVRWMDDQNIGCRNETEARRAVNELNRSLGCQRLTLNSGKTLFLTPDEVVTHFQLKANRALDKWEDSHKNRRNTDAARKKLASIWKKTCASNSYNKGCWDKILKRFYGYTARASSDLLDGRMYEDVIAYPHLAERIFESLARRDKGRELLTLFSQYCRAGESLYESTEAIFFDSCLLVDAIPSLEKELRGTAELFSQGKIKGQSLRPFGKAAAVLCLYWFNFPGEKFALLFSSDEAPRLPSILARAWLAVTAARDPHSLPVVQRKLVGHPSDDVARLSRFISELQEGQVEHIGSYRNLRSRWPLSGRFYDARTWLQLELLSTSGSKTLRGLAQGDVAIFRNYARTRQEKRVLIRISERLAT
jgi:hypothetical protein